MTPFASVAMLEKFALLKIALCRAPVLSRTSACRIAWLPPDASRATSCVVEMGASAGRQCNKGAGQGRTFRGESARLRKRLPVASEKHADGRHMADPQRLS